MATVATQPVDDDGIAGVTFSAASGGGDKVSCGPHSTLLVKNGSGSPVTATITTPGTVGGLAIADRALTVAAGATGAIKLPAEQYENPSDGLASIAWSATTTITFAVLTT